MYGLRPVVELQFDGFSYPAFQQIVSHVAKMANRTHGRVRVPMVIRIPYGGGIGAVEHHSESPEAYFAHTAGLTVVTPSNPADAYSLLRDSIECDDPVVFLEPKRRYYARADVDLPVRTEPIGTAVVRRRGSYATVVAYGPTVQTAMETAAAGAELGWDLEVVDLRSLNPFDAATVVASVRRTGRAVVVHEASRFGGFGAEIAAQIGESAFEHARRAGASRRRLRRALSRREVGAPLPSERRPRARCGRAPRRRDMTQHDFRLPDLGEGLESADIVTWLVAVGDRVEIDQPLVEVETAKANVELPSPLAGVVVMLHGDRGATVAVGAPLVTIAVDAAVDVTVDVASGTRDAPSEPERPLVGYGESPPPRARARRRGPGTSRTVAVRGVRKAVADRMTRSHRDVADASTWTDADATELVALRDSLRVASSGREDHAPRPAPADLRRRAAPVPDPELASRRLGNTHRAARRDPPRRGHADRARASRARGP